ncbi:MAG TPA: hypothetical protein VFH45_04470, partial [Acidimicrobiales bacterium]|nr:hypothetical protein [Acidimicrobiales bacterium]
MTGDDDLLARLATALQPPPDAPSSDEVAALRAVVAAQQGLDGATPAARSATRLRARRPARPAAALAAAALILGTGGAAAAAAGVSLPAPLRAVATAVGLPVDDAAVARAKSR